MSAIENRGTNEILPGGLVSVLPLLPCTKKSNPLITEDSTLLDQTLLVDPLHIEGPIILGPSNLGGPKETTLDGPRKLLLLAR